MTEKQKSEAGKRRSGQAKAKLNPAKKHPTGEKRPSKTEHAAASPTPGESGGKAVSPWVWLIPLVAAALVWAWKSQKSADTSPGTASASAEIARSAERDAGARTDQAIEVGAPEANSGIPAPSAKRN